MSYICLQASTRARWEVQYWRTKPENRWVIGLSRFKYHSQTFQSV